MYIKCSFKLLNSKEKEIKLTLEQYNKVMSYIELLTSDNDITLDAVIDEYCFLKNLKRENFDYIFSSCLKIDEKIKDITVSDLNFSKTLAISSKKQYLKQINIIFNFAKRKGYILENPFNSVLLPKQEEKHFLALNCQNWVTLSEARDELAQYICRFENEIYFNILLVHIILATRINETLTVINEYIKEPAEFKKHYVLIKTKSLKEYRLTITDAVLDILEKIRIFYFKNPRVTNFTAARKLRLLLKEIFNENIQLHGFRSVYRTIVSLDPSIKDIPHIAKEMYISHNTKGAVEKIYHRYDYFYERYELRTL